MEFIKGQWYKGKDSNYYIKFFELEEVKNDGFSHYEKLWGEVIANGRYNERDYWSNENWITYAKDNPVLVEEVRKYLPENHPDLEDKIIENFEIY